MSKPSSETRAVYTAAMTLIEGQGREPSVQDIKTACDKLESLSGNFPPAAAKLAALSAMGCRDIMDERKHAALFIASATAGFSPSIRGLAVILLGRHETAPMGAGLLRHAAKAGDWVAAFLILRQASRGVYYTGRDNLQFLAAQLPPAVPFHHALRQAAEELMETLAPLSTAPFEADVCLNAVRDALSAEPGLPNRVLNEDPDIRAFPNVLSPLECDYLIAVSAILMQPSKVVDAARAGSVSQQYRTSDGAVLLPAQMDVPVVAIVRKLSRAAGINPENGEFLSLLRYRPGQEYRPHHDYLDPDAHDYSRVKASGQRRKTLLTYLNVGYGGGDTAFPELDVSFKGGAGDSLLFENADTQGHPIPASLHAGMPVESGEKWLATLWCREKPFWPWRRR